MRSIRHLAVIALLVSDSKLNDKCLLQHRVSLYFFLDSNLDLDSARMRLSPDEGCIEKLDSLETFDVLEAE